MAGCSGRPPTRRPRRTSITSRGGSGPPARSCVTVRRASYICPMARQMLSYVATTKRMGAFVGSGACPHPLPCLGRSRRRLARVRRPRRSVRSCPGRFRLWPSPERAAERLTSCRANGPSRRLPTKPTGDPLVEECSKKKRRPPGDSVKVRGEGWFPGFRSPPNWPSSVREPRLRCVPLSFPFLFRVRFPSVPGGIGL